MQTNGIIRLHFSVSYIHNLTLLNTVIRCCKYKELRVVISQVKSNHKTEMLSTEEYLSYFYSFDKPDFKKNMRKDTTRL